jgi:hypothetical protein
VSDKENKIRRMRGTEIRVRVKEEKGALLTECKEIHVAHPTNRKGVAHANSSLALATFGSNVVKNVDELSYQNLVRIDLPLRHLFVLRHRRGDYDYSARRADAESITIDLSCHMTAVGIVGRV